MAKIVDKETGDEIEVQDGEKIKDACEELGVPFGCTNGICGTCMIDIIEGAENLTELTEQEYDLKRDKNHRLACQCRIKSGKVTVDFD
ncbi:MAG: 2Fe-2S iron-sulfur cluster-binding protein [Candidatus Pacearchaeota archaeon]